MNDDKHRRLVSEALQLKQAWLLAAAFTGFGKQLAEKDYRIPNYIARDNKWLKRHIKDLEDDFEDRAKRVLLNWKRSSLASTTAWFAQQFNAWKETGFGVFDVGRVHDVEQKIGPLSFRNRMDCPPYAQILLQGFSEPAVRHPEYHLASDMALLFNLFLDSEKLSEEAKRLKQLHNTEHNQSLARSVILLRSQWDSLIFM